MYAGFGFQNIISVFILLLHLSKNVQRIENNQNEGIHCLSNSASLHNHIYSLFYIIFIKFNFCSKRVRPRKLKQFHFRSIEIVYCPSVAVDAQEIVLEKVFSISAGSIIVISYRHRVCQVFVNFSEILIVFFRVCAEKYFRNLQESHPSSKI